MSRKEGALLASRTFALYLIFWALAYLSYVPEHLFSFAHHARQSNMVSENYSRNLDFLYLAFDFVRIVALFAAASWFYTCGPKIENLFFSCKRNE